MAHHHHDLCGDNNPSHLLRFHRREAVPVQQQCQHNADATGDGKCKDRGDKSEFHIQFTPFRAAEQQCAERVEQPVGDEEHCRHIRVDYDRTDAAGGYAI